MTDSKKYIGVSGKYTKNGAPDGFISITPYRNTAPSSYIL